MKSTILSLRHKLFIAALTILICGNTPNVFGETDLLELGQASAKYDDVVVQDVLRVDTLRLESGEIVKLIGARAFGNPARKKKVERDKYGFVVKEKSDLEVPPAEQALEYARELLEGKHVRLEFDAEQKDDEYKTLAYVFWSMTTPLLTRGSLSGDSPICRSRHPTLNMRGNCATRTGKGARTATEWMNKNTNAILRNVKETVAASGALSCGDTVIVGVSGGPDSVALLHALFVSRHELGLSLHVAHFNHNWRKKRRNGRAFCPAACRSVGVALRVRTHAGAVRARGNRAGRARTRAAAAILSTFGKKINARAIMLGHTQDDLVETVLMHILRAQRVTGNAGDVTAPADPGRLFDPSFVRR